MLAFAQKYARALVAIVVLVAQAVTAAYTDHHVSIPEAVVIAIAAANAVLTCLVPDLPDGIGRETKTLTNAVLAGLTAASLALAAGPWTLEDWVLVAVAVAGTLGVKVTNNRGDYADTANPAGPPANGHAD